MKLYTQCPVLSLLACRKKDRESDGNEVPPHPGVKGDGLGPFAHPF